MLNHSWWHLKPGLDPATQDANIESNPVQKVLHTKSKEHSRYKRLLSYNCQCMQCKDIKSKLEAPRQVSWMIRLLGDKIEYKGTM